MSMEKFLNGDRVYELWAKIKSALSGKQDVLTAGDGITIEDDAIRVTTPVRGLTQAEYDRLLEGERGGLCVITDADTVLPEGGEVYSTQETRIGTWIDGKPVYKKTFSGVTPSSNGVAPLGDLSDLSIDTVVEINGVADSDLQTGIVALPCTRDNTTLCLIGISTDKKKLNVFANHATFHSRAFHCTLKYTKTSDRGVSK